MGVSAGDEISFLPDTEGAVRVMATRTSHRDTRTTVWANNRDGDADNSAADIRAQRSLDHKIDAALHAEMDAERDDRSAEQITHDLLAQLI